MGRAFEVRKVAMAKTAAVKSKLYAKYGKEIYMAAKTGSPDPDANQNLKRIIEKAKKDQVSADIIKRAIDKAKGNSDENYIEVRYEGFGPNNSYFIVECLSDNVNRTVAEVRNCFTKTGGKLGVTGSVLHQFENKAVFVILDLSIDETLEILINNNIDVSDIEEEDHKVTIYGEQVDYFKIKNALLEAKPDLVFDYDEVLWLPLSSVELDLEEKDKFLRLMNMLNEIDDVQEIYHNVKLAEND